MDVISATELGYRINRCDFYPDALPTLHALHTAGYRIGIAGNWPAGMVEQLIKFELPVDVIESSAVWGVSKPSPEFFAKISQELKLAPEHIAYVGDRLDNDVLPAQQAGMVGIFLRRGPWGYLHADWPEASAAHHRIDALTRLPDVLSLLGEPVENGPSVR